MEICKLLKSLGPDDIFAILLQRSLSNILDPLLRMSNVSAPLGYIPQAWSRVKVVFLLKADTKDTFSS